MKRGHWIAASFILLGGTCAALEAASPAALPASCDPAIADSHGEVTILCHGLNDAQIQALPKLSMVLDQVMKSDAGQAQLESTLDNVMLLLQGAPLAKSGAARTAPAVRLPAEDSKGMTANPIPRKDVITYDYRGHKISSLTGPATADEGEFPQYEMMLALQKSGEWKKLEKDANHEIKKTPSWLTPYAFKGVALIRLGKKSEAIKALDYVDQHSRGNKDYDQVRKMLGQLRPAPAAVAAPAATAPFPAPVSTSEPDTLPGAASPSPVLPPGGTGASKL